MTRTAMLLVGVMVLTVAAGCGTERFEATLSAGQVMPPTSVTASGHLDLSYDKNTKELHYKLSVKDIADITGATINIGGVNQNGDAVLKLYANTKEGVFSGKLVDSSATGADLTGPLEGNALADLIADFAAERAYVLVLTKEHKDGAIRGQVTRKPVYKVW